MIRAEFASKGVAGSGLGLGIAGTALGLLNNGGNGGGVLGGLFGNGNQATISALQAENSQLKAENYSDKNAKEVYMQSLADNRRLREQIILGKVNELALTTQAKFGCIDGTIANMMGTIGKITNTIVPMSAICPTPMAKYNAWVAPTNTPMIISYENQFE